MDKYINCECNKLTITAQKTAVQFIDPTQAVDTAEAALAGARDIIAEIVNEDQQARTAIRNLFFSRAVVHSRVVSGQESIKS